VKTIEREIKKLKSLKAISGKRGFYRILDRKRLEFSSIKSNNVDVVSDKDLFDFLCQTIAIEITMEKMIYNNKDLEEYLNKAKEELKPKLTREIHKRRKSIYASKHFIMLRKKFLDEKAKD
jgi:hypothetical protein